MTGGGPLRGNRDFQLLLGATGLSKLGTQISFIAVPLLTLRITGDPAATGTVTLVGGLTYLAVSLPGGQVADRFDRRALLIATDLTGALCMGVLALAAALHACPFWLILAVSVVMALSSGVFMPTSAAVVRRIVHKDDLLAAQSAYQARNAFLHLVGPALGGALYGIAPALPLWADTASYLCSALGIALLRTPLGRPDRPKPLGTGLRWAAADMTAGLRFLWSTPFLRCAAGMAAVLNAVFQAVVFLIIVGFAGIGRTALSTGTVISAYGVGALAGGALARWITRRLTARQALLGVTWSCAALLPVLGFANGTIAAAAVIAGCSVLVPSINVIMAGALSRLAPDHLQGRVQSASGLLATSIGPFGPLVAGLLLDTAPLSALFIAAGATLAVVAVLGHSTAALRATPAAAVPEAPATA